MIGIIIRLLCEGITSSNLIWKITADMNGQDEVVVERPISGNVRPGLTYTLAYSLAFGVQSEGVRTDFIIAYNIKC